MRAIRWTFVLTLSLALCAPPVSLAQGRGQGPQGKGKAEKVEARGHQERGRAAKAEKKQKRSKGNGHHPAERAKIRRQKDRDDVRERARAARAKRRPEVREQHQAARKVRRGAPGDRDRASRDRLIERLRREDLRSRDRERVRAMERRERARLERRRPAPVRDRREAEGPMRFRGLDTNGDGRISRREWRGNDVSFRNHDWNRDGVLAGAEVVPGAQRHRVARRGDRFERRDRADRIVGLDDGDRVRRLSRDLPALRVRTDRLGHRVVLAPQPLVTRLDRALVASQRLWSDGPGARRVFPIDVPDGVAVVKLDLDLDDELDLFALPLTLLLTETLVADVDAVVRTERWAAFDRDLDGFVTPAEWPVGRRSFGRFDRDDDLVLVREELFGDGDLVLVDRERFLLFEVLDRDEDGLVAPWEWPGSLESFFFRDFNADGAVSLDEFLGLDADLGVRRMGFDTLDFDRDGEIARVEWVGDPIRFARLDRNDNGVVGRWEFGIGWFLGV